MVASSNSTSWYTWNTLKTVCNDGLDTKNSRNANCLHQTYVQWETWWSHHPSSFYAYALPRGYSTFKKCIIQTNSRMCHRVTPAAAELWKPHWSGNWGGGDTEWYCGVICLQRAEWTCYTAAAAVAAAACITPCMYIFIQPLLHLIKVDERIWTSLLRC